MSLAFHPRFAFLSSLNIAFNIGLNWGNNFKAGPKQDVELRVRS